MAKAYMIMAAQGMGRKFLATFKDFPPRQKAASFTIDQAMAKLVRRDQRRLRLSGPTMACCEACARSTS